MKYMTVKKQVIVKNKETKESFVLKQLTSFGFTENEATLYIYLLQKGKESGGSKIALGTGLHRQYVYIALEKLLKLNLVEAITYGKQKKYKARPPNELEKISKKRMLETSDLVQELNKISTIGHEQDFEVLQGAETIRQYELSHAYDCDFEEEEFIIGGHSEGFTLLMGGYLDEYLHEKNKKRAKVLYIGNDNERELYRQYIGILPNQQYRFMQDLPQGVAHMVIRNDDVLFFSFLNPTLLYIIKSPVVADNYKQFFMMLWRLAKD